MKILNITGGIAIGALAIAGYLMLSDPLKQEFYAEKAPVENFTETALAVDKSLEKTVALCHFFAFTNQRTLRPQRFAYCTTG